MNGLAMRLASSSTARCSTSVLSRSRMSRNIHKRVKLPYPVEGGLGDFLPPAALKTVAIDYQDGLLQRLDEEVRGSPEAIESVAQTVINSSSDSDRVLAFNYASLALNNSYFLDQLKPPPPAESGWKNHQHEMSDQMGYALRTQYGNMVQFKSAFSSAVTGMFTNGFVWFVTDRNGNTGIIPTFGPGTLLIRSRSLMAHSKNLVLGADLMQYDSTTPFVDTEYDAETMNATPEDYYEDVKPTEQDHHADAKPLNSSSGAQSPPSSPISGVLGKQQLPSPNGVLPRFFSTTACVPDVAPKTSSLYTHAIEGKPIIRDPRQKTEALNIGEVLHPLFCISVHEHAWMSAGYGVWGKEEWLRKFWTVLDWEKISTAYGQTVMDIKH